jgi:hypothetical protein
MVIRKGQKDIGIKIRVIERKKWFWRRWWLKVLDSFRKIRGIIKIERWRIKSIKRKSIIKLK